MKSDLQATDERAVPTIAVAVPQRSRALMWGGTPHRQHLLVFAINYPLEPDQPRARGKRPRLPASVKATVVRA